MAVKVGGVIQTSHEQRTPQELIYGSSLSLNAESLTVKPPATFHQSVGAALLNLCDVIEGTSVTNQAGL